MLKTICKLLYIYFFPAPTVIVLYRIRCKDWTSSPSGSLVLLVP